MAQAPWVPLDATTDDGVTLSDKLNQSMPSIYSNHAGNAQPLQPLQGQLWVDTATLPVLAIKQYDGAVWRELWTVNTADGTLGGPLAGGGGGGGASVSISNLPPANPKVGDLWFDSVRLNTFVYYQDGDSSQWVQIVPTYPTNIIPPGTIIFKAGLQTPAGYLPCRGQAVSRVTYAALWADIGTAYGAGDGTTTFNVPDLRGEFIRGLDDGRGVDAGRQLGSAQADMFKSHNHTTNIATALTTNGGVTNYETQAGPYQFNTVTIHSAGGAETRPRNIAMPAFIKF